MLLPQFPLTFFNTQKRIDPFFMAQLMTILAIVFVVI